MARPLRIEFAGALYHITSRGDRREDIYFDDEDRENWLHTLAQVCDRFNWVVHAYCQMSNHYHLLVETVDGNLSRGMRQLNGQYTQQVNRRYGLSGHLYQGRYKAILIQKEAYLLELSRYVVLNPVRAGMVKKPENWPWSSYRAHLDLVPCPSWLDGDWLLSQFGKRRSSTKAKFQAFVSKGRGCPSPLDQTRHQLLLGDDGFVSKFKDDPASAKLREHSKAQRRALALSLRQYANQSGDRDTAMQAAYASTAYTMQEIADHFGVHITTVSKAIRKLEVVSKAGK